MPYRNIKYADPARSRDKERRNSKTVFDFSENKILQLLTIPYSSIMNFVLTCRTLRALQAKQLFNHPQGTHDDQFWALALAAHAAKQEKPASRPMVRTF